MDIVCFMCGIYADFIQIIWNIFGSTFRHYMDTIWIFRCIFSIHGINADNVWSMHIMYRLTTPFLCLVADPRMLFVIFLSMGLSAVSLSLSFLFFLSSSLCHLSFSSCSCKACCISFLLTSTPSSTSSALVSSHAVNKNQLKHFMIIAINVTDLKSNMQASLKSNSYVCACKAKAAVPVAV